MRQATCTRCGEPFSAQTRGRPRKYCQACQPGRSGHHATCECCGEPTAAGRRYCHWTCNEHHGWERRTPPLQVADCKSCGASYVRVLPSRFAYCSPSCKLKHRKEHDRKRYHENGAGKRKQRNAYQQQRLRAIASTLADWKPVPERLALPPGPPAPPPQCRRCHVPFDRSHPGQKYCGRACAEQANVDNHSRRYEHTRGAVIPWIAGYCRECQSPFVARGRRIAFCCEEHAARCHRRRAKQIRSRRIATAARREPIDLATVAIRDGWQCHICRRKVTRATWSLDHLVPLVHGGDHTYDNVALAHHLCNSIRGADGHAQLRLAA